MCVLGVTMGGCSPTPARKGPKPYVYLTAVLALFSAAATARAADDALLGGALLGEETVEAAPAGDSSLLDDSLLDGGLLDESGLLDAGALVDGVVDDADEDDTGYDAFAEHAALFKETDFPSAATCATCHPKQYKEWSVSQHAYAQLSPFMLSMQNTINVVTQTTNGDFCLRCHAPVGSELNEPMTASNLDRHPASREGITCVACHRINKNFGKVTGASRWSVATSTSPSTALAATTSWSVSCKRRRRTALSRPPTNRGAASTRKPPASSR